MATIERMFDPTAQICRNICRYCGHSILCDPMTRTPRSAWSAPAADDPTACEASAPRHAPATHRPAAQNGLSGQVRLCRTSNATRALWRSASSTRHTRLGESSALNRLSSPGQFGQHNGRSPRGVAWPKQAPAIWSPHRFRRARTRVRRIVLSLSGVWPRSVRARPVSMKQGDVTLPDLRREPWRQPVPYLSRPTSGGLQTHCSVPS